MMVAKKKQVLKIIILGDSYVGKTALYSQYVDKQFPLDYEVTIGVTLKTKDVFINNNLLWDTAGQERFNALGNQFYRNADGCVLVYDVTSIKSFRNLNIWKDEFLIQVQPDDANHFPFIVVGNKIDLGSRMVSRNLAVRWCQSANNIPYVETSAKDCVNVELAFQTVASNALVRRAMTIVPDFELPESTPFVIKKEVKIKEEESSCCILL